MKTQQILNILKVVSWILFIGLCLKPCAVLISAIVNLIQDPEAGSYIFMKYNLLEVYEYNKLYFFLLVGLIASIEFSKAYLFYWVIKTISKLNVAHPFSQDMFAMISKMSRISLQIAFTAIITSIYSQFLYYNMLHFKALDMETEYLYLAGILYVIALIFKKGIELQSENELTI